MLRAPAALGLGCCTNYRTMRIDTTDTVDLQAADPVGPQPRPHNGSWQRPDGPAVPRAADLAALGAAGALLAGCGGGSADAPPAAFFRTAGAPTRRILSASTTAAATPLP